jgi:hypothetical protein
MRFLGRKWQKKNNGESNGNRMSCLALWAMLGAFDRAVAPFGAAFYGTRALPPPQKVSRLRPRDTSLRFPWVEFSAGALSVGERLVALWSKRPGAEALSLMAVVVGLKPYA